MLASTIDCHLPTSGMQDVPTDVTTRIDALKSPSGDVAFLANHIDTTRLGITGHSQGACVTATPANDPGVQVVVPMAGSVTVQSSPTLKGFMFIAGMDDKVIGHYVPRNIMSVLFPLPFCSRRGRERRFSPGEPSRMAT